MEKILTTILFKKIAPNIIETDFIDPEEFENAKSKRNKDPNVRQACFTLVLSLINGSFENFEAMMSLNLLNLNSPEEERKDERGSNKTSLSQGKRREGFLGLRNLGCICYMNSMLQQFYMVPTLRYGVLQTNDAIPPNMENIANIDDNMFHQFQRMCTFLDLSLREDYNPHPFCYSYKDVSVI
jgi:uncharacterized UBP type Zn finger protein